MTQTTYKLRKLLRERLEAVSEEIVRGSPEDYATYQRMVGKAEGLREALLELQDLHERTEVD